MRLWSINPIYLDSTGLVALWREALLAQKVLLGATKGYKYHPQLHRFQTCNDPLAAIGFYLDEIVREADRRGYKFDRSKILHSSPCHKITVQEGQIDFEWRHLMNKLSTRAPAVFQLHGHLAQPDLHPLFIVVPGGVELWERV